MKQQDFGAIAELTAKLRSRDKAGLLELAREGQEIRKPTDALKGPYVLDFLDLPDGERLHESDLEVAIALPAEEWEEYGRMAPAELARQWRQWAQHAPLWRYQKHPRGPKKPRPRQASGAKISHVATARLLANMK